MPRLYDHIDLRAHSLAEARMFYETLLPALGFTRKTKIPDFEGTMNDSGKTVAIRRKAIEVLRCQPDGTWKLIVGAPNGRE